MSFELILPFLRPIKSLLLDESVSEIMGSPDASWWYEPDGIVCREETVQFDAGRLRTGLEVIANHLGYLNQKYDPPHPVSVEYLTASRSNPADFRLAIRDPEATLPASRICPR
jgi:hypothetical protein